MSQETWQPSYKGNGSLDSNKRLTHVIYGLYATALVTIGITSLIAIVMNYKKRSDVTGTFLESHFIWQIKTFWIFVLLYAAVWFPDLTRMETLVELGMITSILLLIWYIYRIIKGWCRLYSGNPMYVKVEHPVQCKAYNNGMCVIRGRHTGPCTWDPNNWESCGVVKENISHYDFSAKSQEMKRIGKKYLHNSLFSLTPDPCLLTPATAKQGFCSRIHYGKW